MIISRKIKSIKKVKALAVAVGTRLRMIRIHNYMTLEDMARLMDLSHTTIAAYEYGTRLPSEEYIVKLCDHFNVYEDWILYGKDRKSNESVAPVYRKTPANSSVRLQKAEIIRNAIRNSKTTIAPKRAIRTKAN